MIIKQHLQQGLVNLHSQIPVQQQMEMLILKDLVLLQMVARIHLEGELPRLGVSTMVRLTINLVIKYLAMQVIRLHHGILSKDLKDSPVLMI